MPTHIDKAVFYHIPKTGGTFVSGILTHYMDGKIHKPLINNEFGFRLEHAAFRDNPTDKPTFCFLRHPLSWYQSYWRYKTRGFEHIGEQDWDEKKIDIDSCADFDFNKFVMNVLEKYPDGYVGNMYKHYLEGMDYVGRQESLRGDFIRILNFIGIEPPVFPIITRQGNNVSQGAKAYYNESTLNKILKVEEEAIEIYYSYGGDLYAKMQDSRALAKRK